MKSDVGTKSVSVTQKSMKISDPNCSKPGCAVVAAAKKYMGTPYKWGGESKTGIDCSGLVTRAYKDALNINLPRNSDAMSKLGTTISRNKLKRGDVVFFGNIFGVNHVGIYVKNGKFIHSSQKRGVIMANLESKYFKKRYKKAKRFVK
ncbi:MAG: C40 family peptidase [Fibrobacteria bacterium]|nr:C40 family peptidase [Fibrobacteria bacterium]